MKSTFKDERQMEFSLFPITGIITWIFSKENPLAGPIAVAREARKITLSFPTGSLLLDGG